MKISIISCGWYGTPLAQSLLKDGHEVLGATRSEEKKLELQNGGLVMSLLNFPDIPDQDLLDSSVIVLNIPPFKELLAWLEKWNWNQNSKIIFVSSTSVYKTTGEITETSPTEGDLAQIENWVQQSFSHWVILRFAGLIGDNRHPGKVLSGRKDLKGPQQPVNLIHRDDCIGFTKLVIEKNIDKEIYNVVSDEHHSRKEFYSEFCERKNLEKPSFDETDLSQGKLISNQKMSALYQLKFSRMIGKEL